MMTHLTLKTGLRLNLTFAKDSQDMTFYMFFLHFEALELIIKEI